jgi:RNA polymerase sigma-70 factor (ECF subfamily)
MSTQPGEVTRLLFELRQGDRDAEARLIPLVYRELRSLAARYLRAERVGHTLQPTALVHEAYLRLTAMKSVNWQDRCHFFAVAAQVMRRILVDHARARQAVKRGRSYAPIQLDDSLLAADQKSNELIALDDALNRLAVHDPRQSKIVELRFFGGLSEEETAVVLGISERTVKRDWRVAKAWLYNQVKA